MNDGTARLNEALDTVDGGLIGPAENLRAEIATKQYATIIAKASLPFPRAVGQTWKWESINRAFLL